MSETKMHIHLPAGSLGVNSREQIKPCSAACHVCDSFSRSGEELHF